MAKVDWNASEYKGDRFAALPKGRYLSTISDTEQKPTRDKQGSYFEIEFDVLRPEQFKNRKLWARLNVHNRSEVAQRIGREQWSALCVACGLEAAQVTDTSKLHGKLVLLITEIEDGPNGPTNRVTGFLKPGEDATAAAASSAPAARAAPPPAAAAPAAAAAMGGAPGDDVPF